MYYVYAAIFTPRKEGNGYLVQVPDIPGCLSDGDNLQDAMKMIKDALCGCLCVLEDNKISPNPSRSPKEIQLDSPDCFIAMVDADTTRFRMETDNKAIRKNVSIPAWLNTQAELAGINFSQVLQDALRDKLNVN